MDSVSAPKLHPGIQRASIYSCSCNEGLIFDENENDSLAAVCLENFPSSRVTKTKTISQIPAIIETEQ